MNAAAQLTHSGDMIAHKSEPDTGTCACGNGCCNCRLCLEAKKGERDRCMKCVRAAAPEYAKSK